MISFGNERTVKYLYFAIFTFHNNKTFLKID